MAKDSKLWGRYVFAGTHPTSDASLPDDYRRKKVAGEDITGGEVTTLSEVVRELPRAQATTVAYENPFTDRLVETDQHNAIIDPDRAEKWAEVMDDAPHEWQDEDGNGLDADVEDPLWNIPTSSYRVINPVEAYQPLIDAIREQDLAGEVFGEVRAYSRGGEVHMDLLFDGITTEVRAVNDAVKMGLTTGYDFYGDTALYASAFAQQNSCVNSIRNLTDREVRKHAGERGGLQRWWMGHIEALFDVQDDLLDMIATASSEEATVDFTTLPFDPEDFYEYLGLPNSGGVPVAARAAEEARVQANDLREVTMWNLHEGATYALTYHYTGKEGSGSTLDRHVQSANDILFNPFQTLERVREAYVTDQMEGGDEQPPMVASIDAVQESLRDKQEQFETREEELRARLSRAGEA